MNVYLYQVFSLCPSLSLRCVDRNQFILYLGGGWVGTLLAAVTAIVLSIYCIRAFSEKTVLDECYEVCTSWSSGICNRLV